MVTYVVQVLSRCQDASFSFPLPVPSISAPEKSILNSGDEIIHWGLGFGRRAGIQILQHKVNHGR